MGSILTAVAVGCEVALRVTGVTDSPVEEQAANINNPIKLLNGMPGSFFMQEQNYYSTRHPWPNLGMPMLSRGEWVAAQRLTPNLSHPYSTPHYKTT